MFAKPLDIKIASWKGDAVASFSIIMDDFGGSDYTPGIIKGGNMAAERNLKIATAAVVYYMVNGGEERWNQMNNFIAQGHEIVNHSWKHENPTEANWNMELDMKASKDTLEAHLADSVWQKEITFFTFPYDDGREEDLAYLKEHGYIGARVSEGGSTRINANSPSYDPFHSDTYGYISREYLDAVTVPEYLAEGKDTSTLNWWMTYPDQPYPPYNTFKTPIEQVEQRHIERALVEKGWGLMEMHTITPSQVYPADVPWWSPMSYTKFEDLLDRLKILQECDSLWVDVPSKVAAYIELSNNINIESTDSTINFDYSSIDPLYLTELTLKIATKGDMISFNQSGANLKPYGKGLDSILETNIPDTIYLDVNPGNGPVNFNVGQSSLSHNNLISNFKTNIKVNSNMITLILPSGNYSSKIINISGKKVIKNINGISDGKSPISIIHSLVPGTYFIQSEIKGVICTSKFLVWNN